MKRLRTALIGPAGWLVEKALRCTSRRRGVVIVFHRVGDPAGDPRRELVPALGTELFAAELDLLTRAFRPVAPADLDGAIAARRRLGRFPVAVTFDDDWAGHARVALPLLARAGIPATFFVNGASLEAPHRFWFERLQRAYDVGLRGPPEAIHAHAARIEALRAPERAREDGALAAQLGGGDPPDAGLRAADVAMLARAGHEIAFHTREHHTLPTLDDEELERALRDGREAVARAAGADPTAIAYPSGKYDARVVEAARSAGFARAYTTDPVAVEPSGDPLRLGRVYPSPDSVARMRLVLARALLGR